MRSTWSPGILGRPASEDESGLLSRRPTPTWSRSGKGEVEGNTRRAIDFHEGDTVDEKAFQALVHAAVALNTA
ncbi:hypothetical protein MLGJGCBP_07787 [Rhodococcus sp. T7]|nr:hypothetical protein MLGJGCBP_07787 [Rhodococcus sp. T7]